MLSRKLEYDRCEPYIDGMMGAWRRRRHARLVVVDDPRVCLHSGTSTSSEASRRGRYRPVHCRHSHDPLNADWTCRAGTSEDILSTRTQPSQRTWRLRKLGKAKGKNWGGGQKCHFIPTSRLFPLLVHHSRHPQLAHPITHSFTPDPRLKS